MAAAPSLQWEFQQWYVGSEGEALIDYNNLYIPIPSPQNRRVLIPDIRIPQRLSHLLLRKGARQRESTFRQMFAKEVLETRTRVRATPFYVFLNRRGEAAVSAFFIGTVVYNAETREFVLDDVAAQPKQQGVGGEVVCFLHDVLGGVTAADFWTEDGSLFWPKMIERGCIDSKPQWERF